MEKILLVDDEQNILNSFKRMLINDYYIYTANSATEALDVLSKEKIAVIVSDLKMPVTNGIQLLETVKKQYPDTVRILLTAYADIENAIKAVNYGNIFRLLTKPIENELLKTSLDNAIKQYQLQNTERELLSKTLSGSIKLMTDLINMLNPLIFGIAGQVRDLSKKIAESLNVQKNSWIYELAAIFSYIGILSVPQSILEKYNTFKQLSDKEKAVYDNHPFVTKQLLSSIPRLEIITEIITKQFIEHINLPLDTTNEQTNIINLGTQILRCSTDFIRYLNYGYAPQTIGSILKKDLSKYNPKIIDIILTLIREVPKSKTLELTCNDLQVGMMIAEDVLSNEGNLVLPKNELLTQTTIKILFSYKNTIGIKEPVHVFPNIKIY